MPSIYTQKPKQQEAVEKYIKENIYKDKRYADWALAGTMPFDGGKQVLYKFHIAPWDIVRSMFVVFEVDVLIDSEGRVLDKAVYDHRMKKLDPPLVTDRIVDTYLKQQSDRDMRQKFVNEHVIITSGG